MRYSRSPGLPSPLISVVMASFNSELYISDAIESVLQQSLRRFELIIVDDGSTDATRNLVKTYAQKDPRIRLLFQEHRGLVEALNAGCFAAKGEYIARLDSDDIAMPKRFELQIERMRNADLALLGGAIECIDEMGNPLFLIEFPTVEESLEELLMVNNYIAHTTAMIRTSTFRALGGYRNQFRDAEDYDLFLRVSDNNKVDNLRAVLSRYRLHSNQVSVRCAAQQVLSSVGARIATWERRANRMEPVWAGDVVSLEDLVGYKVKIERINTLISEHMRLGIKALSGWRGYAK